MYESGESGMAIPQPWVIISTVNHHVLAVQKFTLKRILGYSYDRSLEYFSQDVIEGGTDIEWLKFELTKCLTKEDWKIYHNVSSTVKPVLRDHSEENAKVVSYSRWSFNTGSMIQLKNNVVIDRCYSTTS